ncbi:MAG TPA: Hsp20/alpha crystallin family protein [Pyrinomonadaceae bacterium]|jgi:HSP20 family protein|nr:Hsp20/alpha crystallin family protein [Pyrinomonadaceae bacterium]
MANSIDRYFRLMPAGRAGRPAGGRMWCPSADVYRTRDGWVVKVELAGVLADEIEIRVERDTLHIAGCRHDSYYSESLSYHQLEITYSRFEKTIRFPCPIKGSSVKSVYQDGLLILHLRNATNCEGNEPPAPTD